MPNPGKLKTKIVSGAPSDRSRRLLIRTRPPADYGVLPRLEPGGLQVAGLTTVPRGRGNTDKCKRLPYLCVPLAGPVVQQDLIFLPILKNLSYN
jgi:hypothetical protein